ncbi:MAG: cobalamin biosynthesis protein CbiX [Burkholderiaceae bacterium]|nr:MAG: cobalamin biosynthesis protein CbiX [Burkholderiaceae bacterium]
MKPALILFAHGARDPRWAEPFQRLQTKLQQQHTGAVELAFLELMTPDLPQAVTQLVRAGYQKILVLPIFFGRGGHVREDLPKLIAAIQAQHPALQLRCADAAGEDDAVLNALVQYCLQQSA